MGAEEEGKPPQESTRNRKKQGDEGETLAQPIQWVGPPPPWQPKCFLLPVTLGREKVFGTRRAPYRIDLTSSGQVLSGDKNIGGGKSGTSAADHGVPNLGLCSALL